MTSSSSFDKGSSFNWIKPKVGQNFWDRASWVRHHYEQGEYKYFFAFFVDGIGSALLEKLKRAYPEDFSWLNQGKLETITSLYPSTTSVHVPAFLGGVLPEQTGVIEWWYYEPYVKTLLSPLKLKRRDGKEEEGSLAKKIYGPVMAWPKGPTRILWQESSYCYSPVTQHLAEGFELIGYEALEDLAVNLRAKTQIHGPQFHVVYLPQADTMSHRLGPEHPKTLELWKELFRFIRSVLQEHEGADACFISDHGQSSVDPSRTLYLNRYLPGLKKAFLKDEGGKILAPAGSCRNLLLYLEKEQVALWKEKLKQFLGIKAEVLTKEEIVEQGFFLSTPSERFHETFPSLVIIPALGESIWWDEGRPVDVRSQHGGATKEEMEVPFWTHLHSRISFEG